MFIPSHRGLAMVRRRRHFCLLYESCPGRGAGTGKPFVSGIGHALATWSRTDEEGPLRNLLKITFRNIPSGSSFSFSPYLQPISKRSRAIHCSLAVYSRSERGSTVFGEDFPVIQRRVLGTLRATEPSSSRSSSECSSSAGDGDSSRAL